MNTPNRPVTTTATPSTPTPSQFSSGPPKAVPQAKGAETNTQPAQTPAVRRTVRFELDAPKAWSVFLVGTFNDWRPGITPLTHVGGGKWAKDLPLAPGRYEYRFVVDGKWIDDPKAKASVPNAHGGRNAVLEISASS